MMKHRLESRLARSFGGYMNNEAKKQSLLRYVEMLKQRLNATVPAKHVHRAAVFKDMLKLDIKKTLATIEKL